MAGPNVLPICSRLPANTGDSLSSPGVWSFPLVDVTQLGNDGCACTGSAGRVTRRLYRLIQRGPTANPCDFVTKMNNALDAGSVGVVFYMADSAAAVGPSGLSSYGPPAGMVSLSDGQALKSSSPRIRRAIAFQPGAIEVSATANQVAGFSSTGPSTRQLPDSSPTSWRWARASLWPRRATIRWENCIAPTASPLLTAELRDADRSRRRGVSGGRSIRDQCAQVKSALMNTGERQDVVTG